MMTARDCAELSQLIGSVKRAKNTVRSAAAQISELDVRYAGTADEMINEAGVKSLLQGLYWLGQAVETLERSVKHSRAKGGAE